MNPQTQMIEFTFERVIPAPVDEVFDAWLDPTIPGKPWHDAAKLIFTPEVDGLFYFMTGKTEGKFPHYGRFIEIDRPGKVQHTFVSPFTLGLESLVTVTFKKKGKDTLLNLHHEGLPDDEKGRRHEQGWNYLLGVLVEHYAGKR
jgi:uncharacterized protein YndB with AHSA1/START domain